MLPHDGKRKNRRVVAAFSCPNFDGAFEITNFKPPLSFEKIGNGGCIKVAHF